MENRIAKIVAYLVDNEDALVSLLLEKSCLLHVDEIELESILQVFMKKKEDLFK